MPRPWIIDGGLATELEARGHVLHPRLWSAGVFLERPDAVEQLHRDYVAAGADVVISASYQMSIDGFAREGLDRAAAEGALRETVAVARRATRDAGRRVLVAASVGPYAAFLADGSEYAGRYGVHERRLAAFHRERLELLAGASPDRLAIETVPSLAETRVLCRLLERAAGPPAWISFSCPEGDRLADGESLDRAAGLAHECAGIAALGVNCTAPRHVSRLIERLRRATDKPLLVYPNSGERWDPVSRSWSGGIERERFLDAAEDWIAAGVRAIGGCCRVGPELIGALHRRAGRRGDPGAGAPHSM